MNSKLETKIWPGVTSWFGKVIKVGAKTTGTSPHEVVYETQGDTRENVEDNIALFMLKSSGHHKKKQTSPTGNK
jgi:hypothetical protein